LLFIFSIILISGGNADENAKALRDVLAGGEYSDAKRDSIVLNAGFGVYVYGMAPSVQEGVAVARKVLYSGKGLETLDTWIAATQAIEKNTSASASALTSP
jgi:anthranilate phosphoribosyltransferase